MSIQNVANSPTNSYPVAVTQLGGGGLVQTVNAMLPFISNLDQATADIVYTGYAIRGTTNSQAKWFIVKQETIGTVTTIRFAAEPFDFTQVWDNRASLTYT
jgi:hypothetical protein